MCGIHSSSHGTVHDGSWWHWKSQCVSCISGNDPDVNIYWFLRQYLTPGAIWGLYVRLGDTPEATRSFLVDITPSRAVFSAILVPRGVCDNSKMCVRARSLVRSSCLRRSFDVGCHLWPLRMDWWGVWDGYRALVRRNRSKIGLCGPKNVHDHGGGISYFVTQDSTDFFLVDLWLYCRDFSQT